MGRKPSRALNGTLAKLQKSLKKSKTLVTWYGSSALVEFFENARWTTLRTYLRKGGAKQEGGRSECVRNELELERRRKKQSFEAAATKYRWAKRRTVRAFQRSRLCNPGGTA